MVRIKDLSAPMPNRVELEKIKYIQIPRKPDWHGKSIEDIKLDENKAFVSWRKSLAELQEKFPEAILTPYEKNFEVWKQLWHVVDKSDLLIQIIDCRNPFFFRNEDLTQYVKEVSSIKQNFLLVNKADLIPESIRKCMSQLLIEKKIDHVFFSALIEQEKIDQLFEEKIEIDTTDNLLFDSHAHEIEINTERIFDRKSLHLLFKKFQNEFMLSKKFHNVEENLSGKPKNHFVVGMVGFPNVGKSSAINALCGKKKVGVDAKPGKTKNLQTIILSPDITLCDCPGLVFPSLVSSKAEMICNGVISVETSIMEFLDPINFILSKTPIQLLERIYKLPIKRLLTKMMEAKPEECSRPTIKPTAIEAATTQESEIQKNNVTVDEPEPIIPLPSNILFAPRPISSLPSSSSSNPVKNEPEEAKQVVKNAKPEIKVNPREFLQMFAATRGYVTGSSLPDESKSAKIIIRDFITGKIPYFELGERFIKEKEEAYKVLIDALEDISEHYMPIKNIKFEDMLINETSKVGADAIKKLSIFSELKKKNQDNILSIISQMTDDDIYSLIEGKTLYGHKLGKEERRDLKHLIKANANQNTVMEHIANSFLKEDINDNASLFKKRTNKNK